MHHGLKYGLYLAAFIITLGASAYLTTYLIIKGQPEVEVPDLTGQGAIYALKTLSDLGLNLKVKAIDFSDTVPKDHIISQNPSSGTRIKKKREVWVVLSKGSAMVTLPDLRGLPMDQAAAILEQSRLNRGRLSYTYGSGPEQGKDRILAQTPEPMTPVEVETPVDLLLSLGPRPYFQVMPDLTGQPYSLALIILERNALSLGRLETESRPHWPPETVVLQEPLPGSRVARGDLVRLTVSRDQNSELSEYSFHVLEYPIDYGLFHREIKIRVAFGSYLIELHNDWHGPGERVRVAALVRGRPKVQIFEDGEEKLLPTPQESYLGVLHDQDSPFHPFGRLFPPR